MVVYDDVYLSLGSFGLVHLPLPHASDRFPDIQDSLKTSSEGVVQRLFSTFANGWPGVGLLLQRIFTAILICQF